MTEDKIIKEFIETTPSWHKELLKPMVDVSEPCIMCGVIPDKLLELSEALSSQRQHFVEEVEKLKKKRQFPLADMEKKECPKARHHNWFGCEDMGFTCTDCGKEIPPKKPNLVEIDHHDIITP